MDSSDDKLTHVWVKDIEEGSRIRGRYLALERRTGTTRTGAPFISLKLADRTGQLEARVWDRADELAGVFREGEVIEVKGIANCYRNQIQLVVTDINAPSEEVDPSIFLETAPNDQSVMLASLRKVLGEIENGHLTCLIEGFLKDRRFLTAFKQAPAAKNFHHCYLGGLLEHTLSVCRMAVRVAQQYPQLDKDLLIAAAFLHDIGKTKEFTHVFHIEFTDEGRLLGHVVLGTSMVDEKLRTIKGFSSELAMRLKHLILSHHGQYEFGSPKRPKFLEAFALHMIDDLDAKINGVERFMKMDRQEGPWTAYNRLFERYLLKGGINMEENGMPPEAAEEKRQKTLFTHH
jgi:3'-5' exoribonuclease